MFFRKCTKNFLKIVCTTFCIISISFFVEKVNRSLSFVKNSLKTFCITKVQFAK